MSQTHPFYRLAPFIQDYIYRHGWVELRAIQVAACEVLFDSDAHLLLASGTASGKTEAAFLPILSLLHEQPASSVGVLYIGPTKALINDQFYRLEGLLREAAIPVWHWHGDVGQSHKQKLLKRPFGVLQITPESLESLLINRPQELVRLFGDLRFVVIDEIHVFMNADRGRQILCQLKRLEQYVAQPPRRVGLSATLGDYAAPKAWLQADSNRPVICPDVATKSKFSLHLEHFYRQPPDANSLPAPDTYTRYVYDHSRQRQKCLIFANQRGQTEMIITGLRHLAQQQGEPDIYHVHHGSIAAPLRETAEKAMRDPHLPAVTAATITLELGIDLGQLERVIQLEAPFSVASFLQRLGRSGRRGDAAEMLFVCAEEEPTATTSLPDLIPWSLLQAIAIIQLYVEEKWIEPITAVSYPFSLLYHQTMSILAASGELSPAALAQRVLTLPPFRHISADDYRDLLRHLLDIDHIQRLNSGGLIVGLSGEKVVRNFRFYAVFQDDVAYQVKAEAKEIGSIVMPPPPGERFGLAGRTWEVLEIDAKRRIVFAKRVGGRARAAWSGASGGIHGKILQRMRQVLLEETIYRYLGQGAIERLQGARQLARHTGFAQKPIVALGGDAFCLFPWLGSVASQTLLRYLQHHCQEIVLANSLDGKLPYFLKLRLHSENPKSLLAALNAIGRQDISAASLVEPDEVPQLQKYDEFVPPHLLRKALAADYLSMAELAKTVADW